jgi:hypothetical protein
MFTAPAEDLQQSPSTGGGFVAPQSDQTNWSDLPGNIGPDAKAVGAGALETGLRTAKGINDLPEDIIHSGEQVMSGQNPMSTPIGQDVKTVGTGVVDAAKGIPESLMNLGSKAQWVQHPVQNAITAGGLLEGGLEGSTAEPGTGLAGKLGETLEKSGAREATDVAGITPKTIEKMTPTKGNEAATRVEAGKRLVDEGVVGGFGETPEKIRQNQQGKLEEYGNQVKDALGKIRNSGVEPSTDAQKALSPLLNEWTKLSEDSQPEGRAMARRIASSYTKLADIANKNGGKLGFDDIHNEMESVGKTLGKTPKTSPNLGHLKDLYRTLAQSRDAIVDDVSQRSGNPALAKQLQDANKGFHFYSQIGKDVGKTAAKEGVEKGSQLGFYGALWALAHGEPDKAAEYFVGGRLLGPALKEFSPSMAKHSIQAGRIMQKYGPMLSAAAKKGARNLAMTNYVLQQSDPEYADTLGSFGSGTEEPEK